MSDKYSVQESDVLKHEGIHHNFEESAVIVLGAPYDGTVSFRPGTRFGPGAVRQELDGLETYSPYQEKDMTDYRFCDVGDIPLPFGNTERVLDEIYNAAKEVLANEKKTMVIGGEHLISYPLLKAYLEAYPDMHIIHLDAHADLREDYLGERLSHATVMRRAYESLGSGRIWQFGIRSGTKDEFEFGAKHTSMQMFDLQGMAEAVKAIGDRPIYITLDLDVLDPSVFGGTGTPEPGGVTFKELIQGLMTLKGANIVGADMVELAPHYDNSGVSTAVACKLLRELLLLMVS